jgi:hypothetical protein
MADDGGVFACYLDEGIVVAVLFFRMGCFEGNPKSGSLEQMLARGALRWSDTIFSTSTTVGLGSVAPWIRGADMC